MSPRASGPQLSVIWWQDIPAQVVARDGATSARTELPARFPHAIDRAAMGGGLAGSEEYLEHWRTVTRPCGPDLEDEVAAEVAALVQAHPKERVEAIIRAVRDARPDPTVDPEADRARARARARGRVRPGARGMTDTVLASASREVVIGHDRPFVLIGERINPTGRKALAAEMAAGDFDRVVADALAQVQAGATVLDVNAGIPLADEPGILAEAVRRVQAVVDVPLSIDSSIVAALEAGLAAYDGKALVNSVTGEEDRLESVLPLVAKYGAAVVAITNDETGIDEDPDVRFEIARRIIHRAADHGIGVEDIVVDPLVMPIGAIGSAGRQVLTLVRRLRDELGVNSTCGASNVSFGLPHRPGINAAFLSMAIGGGLSSAITNPLEPAIREAVMAADVLTGNDAHCARWITEHRSPEDAAVRRGGRRRAARAG